MKYNLDELHWQEFEKIAFRILQKLISSSIQMIEGGNDKGRDILYEGTSQDFRKEWTGKWLFQAKHKSKKIDQSKIKSTLSQDLKEELEKVFITNKLSFDQYILVTNKPLDSKTFDDLQLVFDQFRSDNSITCKNFDIVSYRHIESCIDLNDDIKWSFPNIISHPNFKILIQKSTNYHLETRAMGWLKGVEKHRESFVNTTFFEDAQNKLLQYPVIILSGPPKSGKTFNAEVLALTYYMHRRFAPILITNPEEIEPAYISSVPQIFICDDAFGMHVLSPRAEEWFRKLEIILNLADDSHLFIFTSREYIFRAFTKFGNEIHRSFLNKIIVESHNYSMVEKTLMLHRYTTLSNLDEDHKLSILSEEHKFTSHRNFSPETIRSFFAINPNSEKKTIKELLSEHLEKPDAYLSTVFFRLDNIKRAALLAVLCSINSDTWEIQRTFSRICLDQDIKIISDSQLEFDELDDSVLKILNVEDSRQIHFYHPSMQEFLIRNLIENRAGTLRNIVLRNINALVLNSSYIQPFSQEISGRPDKPELIALENNDLQSLHEGVARLLKNPKLNLLELELIFKWFKSERHTIDLKLYDPPIFNSVKPLLENMINYVNKSDFYFYRKQEPAIRWAEFIFTIRSTLMPYSLGNLGVDLSYKSFLLKEKIADVHFWKLVFRILSITSDEFIIDAVGKDWLNKFYSNLKAEIDTLGHELLGEAYAQKSGHQSKDVTKPNRTWYPRFTLVKEKIDVLKEIKGTDIGNRILEKLVTSYDKIHRYEDFAKNRHGFNLKQGWWKE